MFETWSYESDRPVKLEVLRKMVQRDLPVSVYRCKGIVFAADSPDKRFALQVVELQDGQIVDGDVNHQ